MEEAPENGKELLHSAQANGMNEWMNCRSIHYYLTVLYVSDCRKVTLTTSVILYFAIAA
jgi:hypothetical protein